MTADDVSKVITSAMPFLTGLLGVVSTWFGIGIKTRLDHKSELRRLYAEIPARRADALVHVMALVMGFAADARDAAETWSIFQSWYEGKKPDADDKRQEFFAKRTALRRQLSDIMATAEGYGMVPSDISGDPHLAIRLFDWGEKLIVQAGRRDSDYETYYTERAEDMLAQLRKLKATEDELRLKLFKSARPRLPARRQQ
jgi:hypothetical protein